MRRLTAVSLLLALVAAAQPDDPPPSAARLANATEVRQRLGLTSAYDRVVGIEDVKVAVLDYGFDGLDGTRRYLPSSAVVVEHYDAEFVRRHKLGDPDYKKGFAPFNKHGRIMAQIVWAVTGSRPRGPKFYLLNANGPTMLRRAVRYAVEQKVDVILFSGTFEGGGNGDGRGPINAVVAEALAADVLWVNAAGNCGGRVYEGPVEVGKDGYLRFGGGEARDALRFRNRLDENTVTVTLTWNDYREQEDAGTAKDLDLVVEDAQGRRLGAAEKRQVAGGKEATEEESRNPRERVVLPDLAADSERAYRIRVKAAGGTFTAADRLRVLVTASREGFVDPKTNAPADAIEFLDASRRNEIYPPADNPLVLTVGDGSPLSAVGPTADHRVKPDVVLEDSRAAFTNGEVTFGASNAAAYFAGVVTVLKAAQPNLRTRHLLALARRGGAPEGSEALPTPAGREITLAQARAIHHRAIIDRVRAGVGGGTVRAWLMRDGRLVLGIDRSPAELRSLFSRFDYGRMRTRADELEYYLSLRQDQRGGAFVFDHYRRKAVPAGGRPDPYPWELDDVSLRATGQVRPIDFVEVRYVPPVTTVTTFSARPPTPRRRWQTPTPDELARLVRGKEL
jgi:hypothetical protein